MLHHKADVSPPSADLMVMVSCMVCYWVHTQWV